MDRSDSRDGAVGMTIISSLMLGSSYVFIKMGVSDYDPYMLGAMAMTVGTAACLVFMIYRGTLTKDMFRHWQFWAAPVLNTGVVGFQYAGLTLTTASAGGLIIGSNVLFVAILSFIFFKERLSRNRVLGLVIGFIGLITITTKWDASSFEGGELVGGVFMLLSAFCIALVMVVSKSAMEKLSFDQWTLALHMFLPFSLFGLSLLMADSNGLPGDALPLIVLIGLVCTTIPTLLWTKAIPKIGAITSSTVLMLESSFAVILSVVLLEEMLDAFVVVGALMTFAAIYFVANGESAAELR
jgi:drug/metabolite transporter (DMT)-like permease